jgi:predicted DNA-binding protein (MmcQ/YjbR family)
VRRRFNIMFNTVSYGYGIVKEKMRDCRELTRLFGNSKKLPLTTLIALIEIGKIRPKWLSGCGPDIVLLMASYLEWVREFCLGLPHTTEKVRWEHNLLFCVGDKPTRSAQNRRGSGTQGKIFCVANLEPGNGPSLVTFKCSPEKFAEMVEIEGIIPAPYMARAHWVSMTDMDCLRRSEIKDHIRESYEMVLAKLPKKTQARIAGGKRAG